MKIFFLRRRIYDVSDIELNQVRIYSVAVVSISRRNSSIRGVDLI